MIGQWVPTRLATLTTFFAFFFATIVSLTIVRVRTVADRSAARPLPLGLAILLNLATAGAFVSFYLAVTMIPATAATVTDVGIGPVLVVLVLFFQRQVTSRSLVQPVLVFSAAVCVVIVILSEVEEALPAELYGDGLSVFLGLLLSLLAGICAVGVLFLSKHLAARNYDSLQVASVRFYLAWPLCGMLAFVDLSRNPTDLSDILHSAVLAVLCITVPILLLQAGVMIASPLLSSLALALLPAVVLAAEIALGLQVSFLLVATVALMVLLSLAGVLPLQRVPRSA